MRRDLITLHVMPPFAGHEPELAADAEHLLETGICTDIAFMMTLVPESDPPVDKARILGDRFAAFRNIFKGDAARLGILAQATIGHGWVPDEPAPFQKIIRPDGTPAYQMCPLDPAFQEYIRDAFLHLASLRPAFIMIDDDFRMLTGRNGCFCPLHLAEMGRRTGRAFSRADLPDVLRGDAAIAHAYDDLLLDSLMELAGIIRDAMDATDPAMPGSFCACYGDIRHAGPLARRLAGAGNPRMVRINNARYLTDEMRTFPLRMYDGAAQIAGLDADITILAETDPFPHNRYSTGAQLMHSHYAGSLLEGCHGAKHWLTRIKTYQPASGTAYRSILARHHGFYETLFHAVQASEPGGYVAAALPSDPVFNPAPDRGHAIGAGKTWGHLLGVLGLPCNYARMPALPVMMTGDEVDLFADQDIRQLLALGLVLEGTAAEKLCQRGFGNDLGVTAEPWTGTQVSGERWSQVVLGPAPHYSKLIPIHTRTRIHSTLLHCRSGVSESYEDIGPAVTLFENASGARVITLAASFGLQTATTFGFYDEDRKRELVALLEWMCRAPLPFYYPGDAEVYLKLRRFADGRYLLAVFNLGHDPLDVLPITSPYAIDSVELLTPDGIWQAVSMADGCLQTPLLPADPKVFRIAVASGETPTTPLP
jgi:hypothetical protein